jgi:hypothetical protein
MEMYDQIQPTYIGMAVNTTEDLGVVQELFPETVIDQVKRGSSNYSLYLGKYGELVFSKYPPESHNTYLNLTGVSTLPEGISGEIPLTMYHEPKAYSDIFEVMPKI